MSEFEPNEILIHDPGPDFVFGYPKYCRFSHYVSDNCGGYKTTSYSAIIKIAFDSRKQHVPVKECFKLTEEQKEDYVMALIEDRPGMRVHKDVVSTR